MVDYTKVNDSPVGFIAVAPTREVQQIVDAMA